MFDTLVLLFIVLTTVCFFLVKILLIPRTRYWLLNSNKYCFRKPKKGKQGDVLLDLKNNCLYIYYEGEWVPAISQLTKFSA